MTTTSTEATNLTATAAPTLLRTHRHGCFELKTNSWGSFLVPTDDPDANAQIDKDCLDRFELRPDIDKIPAELWQQWVKLAFHFCSGEHSKNDLEVSVRLLRREDDPSQWRMLVPRQGVSGGSVQIPDFNDAIDISTGEVITSYPPDGWLPAGSSHSHNTMHLASFSGTDDANELGDPGLHIVLSHIDVKAKRYQITASVTAHQRRFLIPFDAVLCAEPVDAAFHPDVLSYITPRLTAAMPAAIHYDGVTSQYGRGNTRTRSGRALYLDEVRGGSYYDIDENQEQQTILNDEKIWNAFDLLQDCVKDASDAGNRVRLIDIASQLSWLVDDIQELLDQSPSEPF